MIVCSDAINNPPSDQTVTELCSGLRLHTPRLVVQEGHNIVAASGGTIVAYELVSSPCENCKKNEDIQIQYKRTKLPTVHIKFNNSKHCPTEIKQNCQLDARHVTLSSPPHSMTRETPKSATMRYPALRPCDRFALLVSPLGIAVVDGPVETEEPPVVDVDCVALLGIDETTAAEPVATEESPAPEAD